MILALKTPLVETIIGTKIDFLNQFNIFFTFFFPANFVHFNSSTGLILLFLPFFYNTVSPATAQPLLLLNLSRDPFNSISYLHKSAWKSDLGRQTISQFVINYFFYTTCHLLLSMEDLVTTATLLPCQKGLRRYKLLPLRYTNKD
jgi:hypothetical protein